MNVCSIRKKVSKVAFLACLYPVRRNFGRNVCEGGQRRPTKDARIVRCTDWQVRQATHKLNKSMAKRQNELKCKGQRKADSFSLARPAFDSCDQVGFVLILVCSPCRPLWRVRSCIKMSTSAINERSGARVNVECDQNKAAVWASEKVPIANDFG